MASVLLEREGVLFLHLPKTAGFSLSSALAEVPGAVALPVRGMDRLHGAAAHLSARLGPDAFEGRFAFAVVRNPWDWAVSGWKHVTENTRAYPGRRPGFGAFLTGAWGRGLRRNPNPMKFATPEIFVGYHCHLTQWEHLLGPGGAPVPLAHVARFERLAEDLAPVAERLGRPLDLPHRNRSARSAYQRYYTPELRDLVARRDAPLIERFGYRFDGGA
jgi:hypothetical protein